MLKIIDYNDTLSDYNEKIKIAIIERNQLYREGFKALLNESNSFEIALDVSSFEDFLHVYRKSPYNSVDILMIELDVHHIYTLNSIRRLLKRNHHIKIIALTYQKNEILDIQAIRSGVNGFIYKNMDLSSTLKVIKDVHQGNYYIHPKIANHVIADYQKCFFENKANQREFFQSSYSTLSDRQHEVLELLLEGKTSKEIADILSIKEETVRNHVYSIVRKINV